MERPMNQTVRQPLPAVPAKALRDTLSNYATGVAIVTTTDTDGTPYGVTINSFNSVSLEPPLVLWSLALSAWSLPVFQRASGFAVNILSHEQGEACKLFASRDEERFAQVAWERGFNDLPVLDGNLATLVCDVWARHPGGDHEIMIGEVLDCTCTGGTPLVYCQGQLGALAVN